MHAVFVLPSSTRECQPVSMTHVSRASIPSKSFKSNPSEKQVKLDCCRSPGDLRHRTPIEGARTEEIVQHSNMPSICISQPTVSSRGHAPSLSTSTQGSTLVASARSSAGTMATSATKSRPTSDLSGTDKWADMVQAKALHTEKRQKPRKAGDGELPRESESIRELVAFLQETTPPTNDMKLLKPISKPREGVWSVWKGGNKRTKRLRKFLQSKNEEQPTKWVTRTTPSGKAYQQIAGDPFVLSLDKQDDTKVLEEKKSQQEAEYKTTDDRRSWAGLTEDQMEMDDIDFYFPDTPRRGAQKIKRISVRDFATDPSAGNEMPTRSEEIRRSAFERDLLKELDAWFDNYGVTDKNAKGVRRVGNQADSIGLCSDYTPSSDALVPKPLTFTAFPQIHPRDSARSKTMSTYAGKPIRRAETSAKKPPGPIPRRKGSLPLLGLRCFETPSSSSASRNTSISQYESHRASLADVRSSNETRHAGKTAVTITQPHGPDPFFAEAQQQAAQQTDNSYEDATRSRQSSNAQESATISPSSSYDLRYAPSDILLPATFCQMQTLSNPDVTRSDVATPPEGVTQPSDHASPSSQRIRSSVTQLQHSPRKSPSPVSHAMASSDPPHPAPTSPLPSLPEGAPSPLHSGILIPRKKGARSRRYHQANSSLSSSMSSNSQASWSPLSISPEKSTMAIYAKSRGNLVTIPKPKASISSVRGDSAPTTTSSKALASPIKMNSKTDSAHASERAASKSNDIIKKASRALSIAADSNVESIKAQCRKREERVRALKQRDTAVARARHENRLLEEREKQAAETARHRTSKVIEMTAQEMTSPRVLPFARHGPPNARNSLKLSDSTPSLRQWASITSPTEQTMILRKPVSLLPIVTVHDKLPLSASFDEVAPTSITGRRSRSDRSATPPRFAGIAMSSGTDEIRSIRRERSTPTNLFQLSSSHSSSRLEKDSSSSRQISPRTAAAAGCHTPPRSISPSLESSDEEGPGRSPRGSVIAGLGAFPMPGTGKPDWSPLVPGRMSSLRHSLSSRVLPSIPSKGSGMGVPSSPTIPGTPYVAAEHPDINKPVPATPPHNHETRSSSLNAQMVPLPRSPISTSSPEKMSTSQENNDMAARLALLEEQNKMLQAMVIAAVRGANKGDVQTPEEVKKAETAAREALKAAGIEISATMMTA